MGKHTYYVFFLIRNHDYSDLNRIWRDAAVLVESPSVEDSVK